MYALAIFSSLLLLLMSVPIFLVFGIGSSTAAILGLGLPWSTLIQVSFGAMTKHILVAVPLFIFAGMVMLRGGAAKRLVDFATALVGHWPGGLGIAMVIAMGFFAAFCGSILAAITAVGTIMMPKMLDPKNIKQVPPRLFDRVCALVFLDDAFEPDFNKRNLTLNHALRAFQERLDKPCNLKAFESWLQWCNKM